MALYSRSYLQNLSREYSVVLESRIYSDKNKVHTSFDIFLLHSALDKEEVRGLYYELTQQGYSVYVDWIIDLELDRNNVTKSTAELIRNRMKMSKSLLLAISANAALSKWMPWELGYVDGHVNRCAIVPVSQDGNMPRTYKRVEYLLLYPYIKRANIGYREQPFVTESAHEYVGLDKWISGGMATQYNSTNIDEL